MPPPEMHPIPEEIIDLFMEELHDEVETMKNCALVSRTFLTSARRQLFSTVVLRSEDQFLGFSSLIAQNLRISVHVRRLLVSRSSYLPMIPQRLQSIISTFSAIRASLREVQVGYTHSVKNHSFRALPIELQDAFLDLFASPNLEIIIIGDFYDLPFPRLARFTQLRELGIGCQGDAESSTPEAVPLVPQDCPPWNLHTLRINCGVCAAAILHTSRLSSIRSLTVGRQVPVATLCSLLRAVGRSMDHLHWTPPGTLLTVESDFAAAKNVSLPDLKSLVLSAPGSGGISQTMAFFVSLLSRAADSAATERALQDVTFGLHMRGPWSYPVQFDAPGLEAALRHPRYPKLGRVTFRIAVRPRDKRLAEFLRTIVQALPSFHSSGMLEVWCNSERKIPQDSPSRDDYHVKR
ncbi:hypothetical protein LshimejAT787_2100190 [Lyophyllum shimeji]|uniref:Uncharacterized protein n=1 Tax=Lyophyllum shimeji TaxID=47721 RepID=A0A9P3Q141_LYOSH|nr:hypothetical protein LshimejAT787_2100190 [Lyophyllum shimeji]